MKVTVASVAAPEAQAVDFAPLHVPLATTFPVAASAARLAKPAATSAAVITSVAVNVNPSTVTDWPAIRFWNVNACDSVWAAVPAFTTTVSVPVPTPSVILSAPPAALIQFVPAPTVIVSPLPVPPIELVPVVWIFSVEGPVS